MLDNIISISVLAVYIIPAILYYFTQNPRELKAIAGAFGTVTISEGIKYLIIGTSNPRPKGARDCDIFCRDGLQESRPGMPSGHSAMAAFFAGYYFDETDNVWIKVGLIVFAVLVMYSRWSKRCHSLEQIMAGALFGLCASILIK